MSQPTYPGDQHRPDQPGRPGPPGPPPGEPKYGVRLPPEQVPTPAESNPYGQPAGPTGPAGPAGPTAVAPGVHDADPYAGAYGPYGAPSGAGQPGQPGQPIPGAQPPYGGQPQYGYPPYGGAPYAPKPRNAIGIVSMSLGIASIVLFCLNWLAAVIGLSAVITGLVSVNYGKKGLATNSRLGVVGIITGIVGIIVGIWFLVWFLGTPEGQQILRDAGF